MKPGYIYKCDCISKSLGGSENYWLGFIYDIEHMKTKRWM